VNFPAILICVIVLTKIPFAKYILISDAMRIRSQVISGRAMVESATHSAWVEYYEDGKPFNTRCRPWESGINLEAAIH
jgi:hypothetical protein